MTTQHTPGPWNVSEEFDGTSIKAGLFHVTHTIQACGFHEPEVDKAVTQSNAHLIAAAPELLALLIELVDMEGSQPGTSAWGDKARSAIAKATGEHHE